MVNLLKINEIRELSNKDVESKIRDARELRKEVARMKTIIREREIKEEN